MPKPTGSKGRGRTRNNNGKRPQGRSSNFDSNMGRNRGNAQQLLDKFLALARDATSQGDRIAAENYFQHADHYYRVVNTRNEQQEARRRVSNNGGEPTQDPIPVQPIEQPIEGGQIAVELVTGESKAADDIPPISAPVSAPVSALVSAPVSAPVSVPVSVPISVPASAPASAPVKTNGERHDDGPGQESSAESGEKDLESQPVKKPRRGRPPKRAKPDSEKTPTPEAAE